MNHRTHRRRLSVRPRFFLFVGITAVFLAALFIILFGHRVTRVTYESKEQMISVDAVIIRNENVVATQQQGEVSWLVDEGTFVSEGETVARVMQSQYSGDLVRDLQQVQDDILKYQRDRLLGQYHDVELEELDQVIIQSNLGAVRAIREGDTLALAQWQKELEEYMQQREEYLKRNYSSDDRLQDMLSESQRLQEQINQWTTSINAPSEGRISFSIDGCEMMLNAQSLENVTLDSLQQAISEAEAVKITETTEYNMIFRCVQTECWYCVMHTQEKLNIPEDGTFELVLDEIPGMTFTAKVIDEDDFAQRGLLVLRVDGDPEPVMNLRSVRATIRKTYTGLYVPERAVRKEEQDIGVLLMSPDESFEFVPVKIMFRQGKWVMIQSDKITSGDIIRN